MVPLLLPSMPESCKLAFCSLCSNYFCVLTDPSTFILLLSCLKIAFMYLFLCVDTGVPYCTRGGKSFALGSFSPSRCELWGIKFRSLDLISTLLHLMNQLSGFPSHHFNFTFISFVFLPYKTQDQIQISPTRGWNL